MIKKAEIITHRKHNYLSFAPKVIEKGDQFLPSFNAPIMNDVFTFMDGKTKELVNKKKDGVVDAIRQLSFYKDLIQSGRVVLPCDVEASDTNEDEEVAIPALMAPNAIHDDGEMDLFVGNNQCPEEDIQL